MPANTQFNVRLVLTVCLSVLITPVFAATQKLITEQIPASELQTLELDIAIGEVDIEVYDGTDVEIEIELKAQSHFFGLRRGRVDHVELATNISPSTLFLGIDDKDVEQDWKLRIPRHLAIIADLSIGELRIENLENNLELRIGVGEVRIGAVEAAVGEIHLSTGVGEANIRGFGHTTDNERNFVSADAFYEGPGEHRIRVDLGVGEVQVHNQR